MAIWSKCNITDVGKALIADCQANNKTLNFTNCKTSSHNYYNDDITLLTDLSDVQQTKAITEKYVENNNTVKLTTNIDNNQLTTGYQLYTYGLYANNGGLDVLLFVGTTDTPDTVPAVSEAPWQAIINTHITINNSPEITIQVNLAANATMQWVNENKLINITYAELKALRDSNKLVPGQQYRITDYETIINGDVTYNGVTKTLYRSAGHPFDLIVVADRENVLNENARAIQHEGDTYFANSDLNAWKIKYSLDNTQDLQHGFEWANTTNGKGVIWYMEDEHSNVFPFDFKNIQMKRMKITANTNNVMVGDYKGCYRGIDTKTALYPATATIDENDYVWVYTFNISTDNYATCQDLSINNEGNSNGWTRSNQHNVKFWELPNITHQAISTGSYIKENTYHKNCHCVATGTEFWQNSLVPIFLFIGGGAQSNIFDEGVGIIQAKSGLRYNHFGCASINIIMGSDNYSNSFSGRCNGITLGDSCSNNLFGNSCSSITLGNSCSNNSFGDYCVGITLGTASYNNSFGESCRATSGNTFTLGNNCQNNSFGNNNYNNILGNNSNNNSFGNSCFGNIFTQITNSRFGNTCINNTFNNTASDNLDWADGCSNNTVSNTVGSFYAVTMEDNCNNNTFNRSGNQGNIYLGNSVNHCNIGANSFSVVKANKASTTWTSANDGQVITGDIYQTGSINSSTGALSSLSTYRESHLGDIICADANITPQVPAGYSVETYETT